MDFGLFTEQTRRGASQEDAFHEMFAPRRTRRRGIGAAQEAA